MSKSFKNNEPKNNLSIHFTILTPKVQMLFSNPKDTSAYKSQEQVPVFCEPEINRMGESSLSEYFIDNHSYQKIPPRYRSSARVNLSNEFISIHI